MDETRKGVVDSASSAMYIRQLKGDITNLENQKEKIRKIYAVTGMDILLIFVLIGFITITLKIINKNKALAKIDVQINEINSEISQYQAHRL